MEFQQIRDYLKSLPGVNQEMFDAVWMKHSQIFALPGVTLSSVSDVISKYNEYDVKYINEQTGSIDFKFLVFDPKELTDEKLETLHTVSNRKSAQMIR